MTDTGELQAQDLIFSPIEPSTGEMQVTQGKASLSEIEKSTILRVIDKYSGNISKAAKELGLTRTALYRRLDKYDI